MSDMPDGNSAALAAHLTLEDKAFTRADRIDRRTNEIVNEKLSVLSGNDVFEAFGDIGRNTVESAAIDRIAERAKEDDVDPDLLIIINSHLRSLAEIEAENEDE